VLALINKKPSQKDEVRIYFAIFDPNKLKAI